MAGSLRVLRAWPCKLVFVALVVLPFLPAIAFSLVPALAGVSRCLVDGQSVCFIAAKSVREFVALNPTSPRSALVTVGIAVGWLVACYVALSLGWRRAASRLLLALAVTLVFAFLPCFIPPRALGIADNALYILLIQVWGTFALPFGILAFLIYVVAILVIRDFASAR